MLSRTTGTEPSVDNNDDVDSIWSLVSIQTPISRNKRKRQPIGMLGRSSGNHDWLLANASDCVWMETGLEAFWTPSRTILCILHARQSIIQWFCAAVFPCRWAFLHDTRMYTKARYIRLFHDLLRLSILHHYVWSEITGHNSLQRQR